MGRRTDVELLVDVLKSMPSNQASPRRLAEALNWTPEKIERAVERAKVERHGDVHTGAGGVVKYRGVERVGSNGLYDEVATVIAKHWGPKEMRLKNIATLPTATAGTRDGRMWTHPDLVLAADPARRTSRTEPPRLHAIEVEARAGFDIRSVYQAHAQGHGADYSWVFGSIEPSITHSDWERVTRTARQLNVGLVIFEKPGVFGTWRTELRPDRTVPSAAARAEFLHHAVGVSLASEYGLM